MLEAFEKAVGKIIMIGGVETLLSYVCLTEETYTFCYFINGKPWTLRVDTDTPKEHLVNTVLREVHQIIDDEQE